MGFMDRLPTGIDHSGAMPGISRMVFYSEDLCVQLPQTQAPANTIIIELVLQVVYSIRMSYKQPMPYIKAAH